MCHRRNATGTVTQFCQDRRLFCCILTVRIIISTVIHIQQCVQFCQSCTLFCQFSLLGERLSKLGLRSFLLAPKIVQLLFRLLQPCRNPGKSIVQTLDIARSTGAAFGTVVGPLLGLSQSFGGRLG